MKRLMTLVVVTALLVVVPPAAPRRPPPVTSVQVLPGPTWQGAGAWAVAEVAGPYVSVAADLTGVPGAQVEVRIGHDGGWSPWQAVPLGSEHTPDPGTFEAVQANPAVTDPVWVGTGGRFQIRTDAAVPDRVRLLVASVRGTLERTPAGPAGASAARAVPLWPPIVPRTSWDPRRECRPSAPAQIAGQVHRIVVHHTAVFPRYRAAEADDIVRTICLQHTRSRGFADIGYSFLVDAYGTIYQGRAGGILQAVVGAHTSGFNRGSVGIALLGNHQADPVPEAARRSLDRLVAWLVELHDLDLRAVTPHVSTGGTSRYPDGAVVPLPTVIAHRDTTDTTVCPGVHLYRYVTGDDRRPAPLVASVEGLMAHPQRTGLARAAAEAAVARLARVPAAGRWRAGRGGWPPAGARGAADGPQPPGG